MTLISIIFCNQIKKLFSKKKMCTLYIIVRRQQRWFWFKLDCFVHYMLVLLRAKIRIYQKLGVTREISKFFIFCPNNLYGELFLKIQFKGSGALSFFRNLRKFEKRHFSSQPLSKIGENCAFSFRSYRKTLRHLSMVFGSIIKYVSLFRKH